MATCLMRAARGRGRARGGRGPADAEGAAGGAAEERAELERAVIVLGPAHPQVCLPPVHHAPFSPHRARVASHQDVPDGAQHVPLLPTHAAHVSRCAQRMLARTKQAPGGERAVSGGGGGGGRRSQPLPAACARGARGRAAARGSEPR
eukprot:459311-Rhodomonas_salina.1